MENHIDVFRGGAPTMSSREIAELTGSQHANIKISAERLAAKGAIGTLALQEFTHNGNTYIEYLFFKRDSIVLVAQNCPRFLAAVVDRWQDLERQAQVGGLALPDFTTPAIAARAWADQYEARQRAESQVAGLAAENTKLLPKAAVAEKIASANGAHDFQSAAKILGLGRTRLFELLREKQILTPTNIPYQSFIERGYFLVRESVWSDGVDDHLYAKPLVTGKGLTWIARNLETEKKMEAAA